MTFEEFPNAIERVLSRRDFVEFHGPKAAKELRTKLKAEYKLDYRKDEPLPQWAIDILKDVRFGGYKTRVRVIFAHQFDITDTNPSNTIIHKQEEISAPPKPPPEWLVEHRESKAQVAKRILEKYK